MRKIREKASLIGILLLVGVIIAFALVVAPTPISEDEEPFFAASQIEAPGIENVSIVISENLSSKIQVAKTMESKPKAKILKVIPSNITESEIEFLAKELSINASVKKEEDMLGVSNGSNYIIAKKSSGTIIYRSPELYSEEVSISKPEAIDIADDFLRRHNLLSEGAYFERVIPGVVREKINKSTGEVLEEHILGWQVVYKRNEFGLEFYGPGSKVVVHVSNKDGINGFRKVWRELEVDHETQLCGLESALEKFKDGKTLSTVESGYAFERIIVKDIKPVYLTLPWDIEQELVEPVYLIECEGVLNETATPFHTYVSAIGGEK